MMGLQSRHGSVPRPDSRVLALALPLVATVRLALWLLPSAAIVRLVRRLATSPERSTPGRPSLGEIVRSVEASSRRVPRASCLTQAVTAQLLLHHYGYGSTLCVGVAKEENGSFRAHAWVERGGRIVIGGEASRRLVRLELTKPGTAAGVHT
jgi:hypothetical protein